MDRTDFFTEEADPAWSVNGDPWSTVEHLDTGLLDELRKGPARGLDDVTVALGLVDLLHTEFEKFGTGGGEKLDDDGISRARQALEATVARLGITFKLPFRDFQRFKSYWLKHDGYGSWQARRDILEELFEPLTAKLAALEERLFAELAEPASPRTATGWPAVDEEISELKRRFRSSTTPQDYRAVGTHCVGVIEALSRTVYNPAKHLRAGETEPPVDKSKQRLDRYIEDALSGQPNEELRGLAKRAVAVAHQVKHRQTPSRRDAGIAADTVILLANILRRLNQD